MTAVHILGTSGSTLSDSIIYHLQSGHVHKAQIRILDDNAARRANYLHLSENHAWRGGSRKKGNRRGYDRK